MLDKPSSTVSNMKIQSFEMSCDYPVVSTRHAFDLGNRSLIDVLARRETGEVHRCAVFVDVDVLAAMPELSRQIREYAVFHARHLTLVGAIHPVAGGEISRNNSDAIPRLLATFSDLAIDRHCFVIAIGSGAVLDTVGYAAAIFHRGVRHVRIPTTVLTQDDNGDGVSNAIHAHGLRHLLGSFAPPWAIINDSAFIDRLSAREKRAGMAEAVKVALIRDGDFFRWIEGNAAALARFSPPHLDQLIRDRVELDLRQLRLGGDPFEVGSARPLDFGHWSAYQLEQLSSHALNHGEAVAIGIALDTRYSVLTGLLSEGEDRRVAGVLERLGFTLWHEALRQTNRDGRLSLLQGLVDFQERPGGERTIMLPAAIGRGIAVHAIHAETVLKCIDWLQKRSIAAGL
jgi:3-dehydroquinate synthase